MEKPSFSPKMKLAISKEPKDPVRRRLTLDQVLATLNIQVQLVVGFRVPGLRQYLGSRCINHRQALHFRINRAVLAESPSHSEVVRIPEKDNDDDVHGTKLEKRGNNSCPRGMRVRISPRAVNHCNPACGISIGRDEPFKVQSGKWLDITRVVRANSKGDAIRDGYMAVYLDKEVVIDVHDLVLLKNGHDLNNWMRSSLCTLLWRPHDRLCYSCHVVDCVEALQDLDSIKKYMYIQCIQDMLSCLWLSFSIFSWRCIPLFFLFLLFPSHLHYFRIHTSLLLPSKHFHLQPLPPHRPTK